MKEIVPGIYQLPIPIPNPSLSYVNAYLVRGDGEVMLVDAGWNTPDPLDALYGYLRALGLGFRSLIPTSRDDSVKQRAHHARRRGRIRG